MKVENSHQSVNRSNKAVGNKKSKAKRIVKVVVVAGVAAGAVALYKNRNTPFVQRFVNILNNDILAPLKQKDVPFKDKILNIGENLRNTISSLTSKRNGYDDVLEIARPAASPQKPLLALPEKAGSTSETAVPRTPHNVVQPVVPEVIELPGEIASTVTEVSQDAVETAGKNGGKIITATGTGALLTGSAVIAAVNNDEQESPVLTPKKAAEEEPDMGSAAAVLSETEEAKEPEEVLEPSNPVQPVTPAKPDKVQTVTLDDKEFHGIFEDGIAYDEECEPLTGKLIAEFESGKVAVIRYQDGVLQKSLIFEHKEDETPKEIKTYINGRIHQKFEDITLEDGAFVAKTTSTYRASGSMIQSRSVVDGDVTRITQFKNNTDAAGKINGKPLPVLRTDVRKLSDGSERRTLRVLTPEGEVDKTVRISKTLSDGTKHIRLIGNNGKAAGEMRLDENKKIKHYITSSTGNPNEGYLYIEDGKLSDATTEMIIDDKKSILTFPSLEKLDCSNEEITVYRKSDGSVIEVEHDKQGYIISIASYVDGEAYYPECVTTFDHGTPLEDIVYDKDGNLVFKAKYSIKSAEKKTEAPKAQSEEQNAPEEINRANFPRPAGRVRFNSTYNVKTFYEGIWKGKYYENTAVKEITRSEEDAYETALLNPYRYSNSMYKILLDQNNTIQRIKVYNADAAGDYVELFMDEEGHIEADELKYALKTGQLTKIGPFREHLERYQVKGGAVIEFVKNEDDTVASIGYYEDETQDIPVSRTFVKDGMPKHDVLYDKETGEPFHVSDYDEDMADVENPLEDVYTNRVFGFKK